LLFALLLACGGAQTDAGGDDDLDPRDFYPMSEGNVWTYDVETGVGPPALGISRVVAVDGPRVSVENNQSDPIVYELREEGIYRVASGTWLLKKPLEVGATWPSSAGRQAQVSSVTETVTTNAGTFEGCVKVEESDPRQPITTVYCPGVGPVILETGMRTDLSGETVRVRGELRAYQLSEDSEL
jgi:hypothetical protein